MILETATLIAGSEIPTDDGVTGALRCVLLRRDGTTRTAAILKRALLHEVVAEAFCALLMRAWGLPVPEPFLVPERHQVSFASADATYPNLRKRLNIDNLPPGPMRDAVVEHACQLATSLRSAGTAAAADEAVQNYDRNLGNILWDGENEYWIDHAYALGGAPEHIGTDNKLCVMATRANTHHEFSRAALAGAFALRRDAPGEAGAALPAAFQGAAIANEVAARMPSLAAAILNRFPRPKDLLSQA